MAGFLKSLFRTPTYRRYVVLGDSRRASFWDCRNWREHLFPVLDDLLKKAACESSVHCRQVTGPQSKEVRLGMIEWKREDAKKWCHAPELTDREDWKFVDLQVFCPAKPRLIKEQELPTIYIQVKPMTRKDTESKTTYDEGIHLALSEGFARERAGDVDAALSSLARTPGVVAIYGSESKVGQLNAFESIVREDFMYRGILESELPDVTRMRGRWTRLTQLG